MRTEDRGEVMATRALDCYSGPAAAAASHGAAVSGGHGDPARRDAVTRTAAGERAARRRAPKAAVRRPPSGLVPSTRPVTAVTSEHGSQGAQTKLVMGRWARLATSTTLVGVIVVVAWLAFSPARPIRVERVVVTQGDTLWAIAQRAQPDADPRRVIADIQSRNHLIGDRIAPGAVLQVPMAPG